ncbi:MAG TPA: sigma-70 family RNA polymerase sigma factor [Candidatus Paceibacterota bacterium]|nr:sigma-70 family RNA polymerase sigma factor [Verrucomicrobiota bacterium]HSA11634.1 sigma-70 family RNA polymerase sigma factor [Candidatus Paceibacterota bacterium]
MKTRDHAEEWIPTRQSLLTRLKNWDDQEGWREFFETYWRLIYGVARKAGLNDAEGQEVVQETVIAIAKKMKKGAFKYDPARGSFKAWLLTLTQWRISDQLRKRQQVASRHPDLAAKTDLMETAPDSAAEARLSQHWDAEWQNNLLQVALEKVKSRVSARTFQIFQLHVVKDWPVERVVQTVGVGRAQVYLAKHRVSALVQKEAARLQKRFAWH